MYCQIELETTGGKIFTGPFVFGLSEGIRKLSRMGWMAKTKGGNRRGVLRLVEISTFPKEVLWHPKFDDENGGRHDRRVRQAEMAWERYEFLRGRGERE